MLSSRIPAFLIVAVLVLNWSIGLRAEGYAVVVGVNECPKFRLPDGTRPRPLRGQNRTPMHSRRSWFRIMDSLPATYAC